MPETFEAVWRRARLEMPVVPALLVRSWAQEAYSKICDRWGWSFLRAEANLYVRASRTITATLTQFSSTILGTGQFVATDQGRQIRPIATTQTAFSGTLRTPIYTIISVDPSFNLATLDRPYTEDTATGSVTIQDIYTTLPVDFRRFLVIYDRYYLRVLPFWLSEDQIAIADPGRTVSDVGPRYLIAQKYSPALNTLGQVRYEYWPAPTAERSYPYLYIRRADQLADNAVLPGVLSERSDLMRTYCLMRGAGWPGTSDERNPYYDLANKRALNQEFETDLEHLTLVDDNEYPQQLMTIQWARRMGAIAPTATLLRQTDATINDYY